MKNILAILIMLAFAQALISPSAAAPCSDALWTCTYGGANDDIAYSVQQTTDGGYIVAGWTRSFGAGDSAFYLVKTDDSGNPLWTRTYGGAGQEEARFVQQTTDGGYILAGWTNSFGAGAEDLYLVKTNSSGDTLWTRTYGGSGSDYACSVQQTADGGYIVAGWTCSFGAGGSDFYLVKTDGAGDTLWTRTYGGACGDWANCIQQTTDAGYIVVGCSNAFGPYTEDFYLVKTNSSGDTLWTRTYGGSGRDWGSSVLQTADGGYIVAGTTRSYGAGLDDIYLVKTDGSGNPLWTRTYGGAGEDIGACVQLTSDGGYIVEGHTRSWGAGLYDFYLLKTDDSGNPLWTRTWGGANDDAAYSGWQTTDGGFILAGLTGSFGAGSSDFWLVKTGPDYPGVGYVTLISPGPPNWGYRLNWVSGSVCCLTFTNFCGGTIGSVGGDAAIAGWTAANYANAIVFKSPIPLTSGSIDTFWLSHPYCSDFVIWTAGDSSGTIEGPLPVELTTFEAIAGVGQVTLRWRTASELDNDHFVLYKRKTGEESFRKLVEIPGHGTTTEPHDYDYVDRYVQNGVIYEYQISDVDITGRETIHEQVVSATPTASAVPLDFGLYANYPNPFNPATTIHYDVKETGLVSLKVFDLLGREVVTLVNGKMATGSHTIVWDATGLPSGVYLCRMEAERFTETRKMVLVK